MAISLCFHSPETYDNMRQQTGIVCNCFNRFYTISIVKKYFLLLIFCVLVLQISAQNKQHIKKDSGRQMAFPQSFIGNWKGTLLWMKAGKSTQRFTMQLRIQPTDTAGQYTWQIIYGDSAKDNRPYILKPVDIAAGHWAIDERDGIILDSYIHGNAIHGAFTVQENTIVDNYRLENNQLFVEFFSINLNKKNTSGLGTEDIPSVDSYQITSYQSGTLLRVK